MHYVACPPCTYRCNEVHALGTHGCLQPQYRSSQVPPSCRDALDSRVRNQPSLQSVLQPFLPFSRIQTRKVQLGGINFDRYHRSLKPEKAQRTTSGAPLLQRSTAEQHSSGCFSLDAGLLSVFCFSGVDLGCCTPCKGVLQTGPSPLRTFENARENPTHTRHQTH